MNNIILLAGGTAVIMAILFIEPLRKFFALLLALAVAFAAGYWWPKTGEYSSERHHPGIIDTNTRTGITSH